MTEIPIYSMETMHRERRIYSKRSICAEPANLTGATRTVKWSVSEWKKHISAWNWKKRKSLPPEDLNIIKNGPSERRRFMDIELCQLNGFYVNSLAGYNKTLNQRNRLLKDISFQPGLEKTLDIWDMQLLKYGKELIRERKSFLNELNETVKEVHSRLTGGQEEISVIYEPSSGENSFEADLLSGRERDLKLKMSGTGPHRDDFCVMVNGIDIRKYGSQGQQRTSALSLKLSEIYLVKNKIKDTPVLLLDDVLSELDSSRQNYLMDSIHDIQTIITCTGLDEFVSHQFEINKVFHIVQGKAFDI